MARDTNEVMRPDDIAARLRASPLFRDVSAEQLRDFARETSLRRYDEGQALWLAGDPPTHITLILRGLVQVVRRLPNGDVSTVGLFGPREPIGTVAVIHRRPYPAEALALSEVVETLSLRAEPVLAVMATDPSLALAFNRVLCDTSAVLRARIDVLSAGSVPRRLATLLLQLADRFGDVGDDGVVRVPVALSRGALARLVSARVETVIRTASEWQKRSLLGTDAGGFELLDVAALQRIADEG